MKSHSSSLEEDQSQSAYERIVGEKKPKAPAPRPSGPGFVVRKRAHVEPVPPAPPVEEEPAPAVAAPVFEEEASLEEASRDAAPPEGALPEAEAEGRGRRRGR